MVLISGGQRVQTIHSIKVSDIKILDSKVAQARRKRGAAVAAAPPALSPPPPNFLVSKKILFTLQFLNEKLKHFIVIKNIDSVYYKCNSCVYQTLNKDIVERNHVNVVLCNRRLEETFSEN